MSKAAAATSNHKSSFSAAALVTTKDTLTFRLHPKQLVAFRSKATEIPYRRAAGGGKPLTGTRSSGRHATLGQPRFSRRRGEPGIANRALFCTIKHTDDGLGMPACASRSR